MSGDRENGDKLARQTGGKTKSPNLLACGPGEISSLSYPKGKGGIRICAVREVREKSSSKTPKDLPTKLGVRTGGTRSKPRGENLAAGGKALGFQTFGIRKQGIFAVSILGGGKKRLNPPACQESMHILVRQSKGRL